MFAEDILKNSIPQLYDLTEKGLKLPVSCRIVGHVTSMQNRSEGAILRMDLTCSIP
jgi:hypothetical protein